MYINIRLYQDYYEIASELYAVASYLYYQDIGDDNYFLNDWA